MSQVHKNIIIISLRLKNTTLHESSYVKNIEFRILENSKAQLVAEVIYFLLYCPIVILSGRT